MERFKSADDATLRRWATYAALTYAAVLVVLKVGAWLATGSLALLNSAVDAVVDALASLGTYVGVIYAQQPPDRGHRYGHGKGEALAALLQATILAGAGVVLIIEAIRRLFAPPEIAELDIGIWIIVASLVLVGGLVLFQGYVVRRTGSHAIAADRAHYSSDILLNIAVLAALAVTSLTGWSRADPIFGMGISAYMLWSAWRVAQRATEVLLDHELPREERERIKAIVTANPEVSDLHDLRTRHAGDRRFVELHLEVDGGLSVEEAHRIAHAVEAAIRAEFADAEVTIHQEPAGIEDDRLDDRVRRAG